MRRTLVIALTAGLAAACIFVGGQAANAVDAPPPPVVEIPDVPSRTVLAAPTSGGAMADQTAVNYWRLMNAIKSGQIGANGAAPAVTELAAVPKPITGLSSVSRGLGGAGMLAFGGQIGWMIGQTGLMLYSGVTNSGDITKLTCQAPDWYQVANSYFMAGAAPDCKGGYVNPNADKGEIMSYGGFSLNTLGTKTISGYQVRCAIAAGNVPSGSAFVVYQLTAPAGWATYNYASPTFVNGCKSTWSTANAAVASVNTDGTTYGGYGIWATSGHAIQAQSTAAADPTRTPSCTITWADSTTTTGTGTAYKESTGLPLSSQGLGCYQAYVSKPGAGPGLMPSRIQVDSNDGGSITHIADTTVPTESTQQKQGLTSPNGHGLILTKTVNGITDSCMTWAADCSGWWSATSSGTVANTGTATYNCTYGGAPVDLVECGPYRNTFDTKTTTPTVTDPTTGGQVSWSSQPGTQSDPSTSPASGPTPGQNCMDSWSSVANPIEWVFYPVKCALVWAFVPRVSKVNDAESNMESAWAGTPMARLAAIVPPLFTVPTGDGGCAGPHIHWELTWPVHTVFDAEPLNACNPPASGFALASRIIQSVLVIGYTIFGVTRRFSSIVNAPGIGPQ